VHPYRTFPDRQFWNRAVSPKPWADVFMGQAGKFRLTSAEPIASAGSCFARRIAEHLRAWGYNYELYESCHPLMAARAADYGYGVFSCRYGNIYTARQLRQLFEEALGLRAPIMHFAKLKDGGVIDLMRPNLGKASFGSVEEAHADRLHHLSRVREMIMQMSAFVFTLGLTEAWCDPVRDVVYGSHPGVFVDMDVGDHIRPVNFDYEQVLQDMEQAFGLLARHGRDGGPRVILTVSPVGLAATHQDDHVLSATSYSKSVLRAVAGKLAASFPQVDYFPSFEIFSLSPSFGQFLADDLRDVNVRGVEVAMRVFTEMFLAEASAAANSKPISPPPAAAPAEDHNLAEAECDEIANAFFAKRR